MSTALAILAALAVFMGMVTAILGVINQRRISKTAEKVQTISVNVDGRMSEYILRVAQLTEALHAGDVPVPHPELPNGALEKI
jgi:hypothetical protein